MRKGNGRAGQGDGDGHEQRQDGKDGVRDDAARRRGMASGKQTSGCACGQDGHAENAKMCEMCGSRSPWTRRASGQPADAGELRASVICVFYYPCCPVLCWLLLHSCFAPDLACHHHAHPRTAFLGFKLNYKMRSRTGRAALLTRIERRCAAHLTAQPSSVTDTKSCTAASAGPPRLYFLFLFVWSFESSNKESSHERGRAGTPPHNRPN